MPSTTSAPAVRPRRAPVMPDQHGAWAFLALPVALAAPSLSWHPVLVPLVLAWVAAYPAAWALTGRLAAPRPDRFDRALRTWLPVAVPAALIAAWWRPWLVAVGLLYAVGFLVSLRYARARRERALGNDLVLIAQCSLLVPVLVAAGAGSPGAVPAGAWALAAVCLLALLGSTLHVKSLIRERRRPGFARASRAYAAGCLVAALVAASLGAAWLVVPAGLALARSLLVADPTWRPARIGMVELGLFTSLAVAVWWA